MKLNGSSLFRSVFILCAAISLLPLWIGRYLPMVDLPQHAIQISIINHLQDPNFHFAHQYLLDWFVPYSFTYFLSAVLAKIFGILISLKIVISLAVISLPLAFNQVLEETGGDSWWSLIGFPFSYGFSFYWGFLSYVVAVPIGFFFFAAFLRFGRRPSFRSGLWATLLGILLFFSHAIVFLVCGGLAALAFIFISRKLASVLPLLVSVPFVLMWMLAPRHQVPKVNGWIQWGPGAVERLRLALQFSVSNQNANAASYYAVALLLIVFWGARLKPFRFHAYVPFLASLAIFLCAPHHAMDISFIFQRLAVFPLFFLLCPLGPAASASRRLFSRVLLSGGVMAWGVLLTFQFHEFNSQAQGFDAMLNQMAPAQRAVGMVADGGGSFPFEQPFNHFPAYYEAFKGGEYSFNFATSYKSVARFKPGYDPLPSLGLTDLTGAKHVDKKVLERFDYVILRSRRDNTDRIRANFGDALTSVVSQSPWWVYQTKK